MNQRRKLSYAVVASAMLISGAMASCSTDNGYDLSNIDSTMKFEAKDLVIPFNVDTFDLQEQSRPVDYTQKRLATYNKVWDDWASEDLSYLVVKSGTVDMTVSNSVDADMNVTFSLNGKSYVKSETDTTRYAGDNSLFGTVSVPAKATKMVSVPLVVKQGIGVSDIYGATIEAKNSQMKVIPESSTITVLDFKIKLSGYYQKEF